MTPQEYAAKRFDEGFRAQRLLSTENVKLLKGEFTVHGLSLAPAATSGMEVCASRSPECTDHCIFTSGRGRFFSTRWGRIAKTMWFFRDRDSFMKKLDRELDRAEIARLNVFSDWQWERQFPWLFEKHPDVQFYDYTKHLARMFRPRPVNYHLTFSVTETTKDDDVLRLLDAGHSVAVVVDRKDGQLWGRDITDGDEDDFRFLNAPGSVIGLTPKGSLKKANSNFVRIVQ